jgi:hypothetical protein
MTKPHKHAELIKAWADGATIQARDEIFEWADIPNPTWQLNLEYRIKREPKPDVVEERLLFWNMAIPNDANLKDLTWARWLDHCSAYSAIGKFKLTYDGETGELKHAEVVK